MLQYRHRLLRSLLAKEKISERMFEILLSWRHPGFSVFQGDPVPPEDHQARERLAGYMAHPTVALYRFHYDRQARHVTYARKHHEGDPGPDAPAAIHSPALDFLAALCSHILCMIEIQGSPSRVLGDQMRSLDKSRLGSRIGTLSAAELSAVEEAILITLGFQ